MTRDSRPELVRPASSLAHPLHPGLSRSLLILAAVVPWALVTIDGLVLSPMIVLDTGFAQAWGLIGEHNRRLSLWITSIGLGVVVIAIVVAWIRVRSRRRSPRDSPFSLWRTLRIFFVVYFVAFLSASFAPFMLSIHLGVMEPLMYESIPRPYGLAGGLLLAVSPWAAIVAAAFIHDRDRREFSSDAVASESASRP